MTKEQTDFLREMATKYNLTKDDFFKSPQGWAIIKRTGVDKIQGIEKIKVEFETQVLESDFCVVKAKASKLNNYVESYGEASIENCKNKYPVSMAEKRALSRVVLKLVGAYAMGIYSEDESSEFKKEEK